MTCSHESVKRPGDVQVTTAADIFSFGVLLWEVCTLEQPINRYFRDIEEHEAPPAVRQLFSDCVHEIPSQRPTAREVLLPLHSAALTFPISMVLSL